ncbi:MAG: hypothetical protein J5819_07235 [Eubacterium sp.]|nr:hypothetical protein [Eubacterium sp.]
MQLDFHYYATYCAAALAGYSHEECMDICYSAQFVDICTKTFLQRIGGPLGAATTQLQLEMMDARTDAVGLHDITRIWASFHFLPYDLNAEVKGTKKYRSKYRLICGPNGKLVGETVELAKDKSLQAVGIAMHIMADTWAHRYFAGTPSLVINNTNRHFYELKTENGVETEVKVIFKHLPGALDDLDNGVFINSIYQSGENSIMNLGHGRAGHFPDYSFARYKYLPAWADYKEFIKDNPTEYYSAFCQMVYAMRYLRGEEEEFKLDTYATDLVEPHRERIQSIMTVRRLDACDDWREFGESLTGQSIDEFSVEKYEDEYRNAAVEDKEGTFLGKFISAAMAQKSMVTNRIYKSGSKLAGKSVEADK